MCDRATVLWGLNWIWRGEMFYGHHRIIGWKRPLRSSSSTIHPTPPCLLNHVPKCHIHTVFGPLQGWGLPHRPEQPVPVPDRSLRAETFPSTQPDVPRHAAATRSPRDLFVEVGQLFVRHLDGSSRRLLRQTLQRVLQPTAERLREGESGASGRLSAGPPKSAAAGSVAVPWLSPAGRSA